MERQVGCHIGRGCGSQTNPHPNVVFILELLDVGKEID